MTRIAPSSAAASLDALVHLLDSRRAVALAGAGCSTESGIPDYRGAESARRPHRPMRYQEFVGSAAARARYWGRSAIGWPRMAASRPNAGHRALADLEAAGVLRGVITQNVDGLHQAAGSRAVIELHGSLAAVRCLGCGGGVTRDAFQERLLALNAGWTERVAGAAETTPDGDAALPAEALERFRVPECDDCGGVMKPDVVFFGENVPAARVGEAWRLFEEGDVLLVVGSSLTVYSGRRFVDRARRDGVPVAVVNIGPTRADDVAAVKVEDRLGRVLPDLAAALLRR